MSTILLHCAATPPCQVSADMYFVIDSTRSLGQSGFDLLQSWTANFVDGFDITSGDIPRPGTTRVGVVEFWGEGFFFPRTRRSEVSVALGDYNDKADLINKINALRYHHTTSRMRWFQACTQKCWYKYAETVETQPSCSFTSHFGYD